MGTRERWTLEEKIKIIEAGLSGDITTVCRQYGSKYWNLLQLKKEV